jgi:general secretion pathway protein J
MSTHRRHPRGFTLLEIMIAISMTASIGALVAMYFSTSIKTKEIVESEAERYRMVRTAMNRMSREIGAAFVSARYDLKRYRDYNDRPTNFIGESNRLLFTSLAHQRLYSDAKESDQMVVEYWIKSTQQKTGSRDDLYRRENPNVEDRMDRGGNEDILLEGVKRIEFAYWDPKKKDWDDDWDTRKIDRKANLPTRVRITITVADAEGKEIKYSTQTRVMLNSELG